MVGVLCAKYIKVIKRNIKIEDDHTSEVRDYSFIRKMNHNIN